MTSRSHMFEDQMGKVDLAGKEFEQHLRYPYHASQARRRRIERAEHDLPMYCTKEEVLARLGSPDLKYDFAGFPPEIPASQEWCYVHTLEHSIDRKYSGKMIVLCFLLDKNPPTVGYAESHGFHKEW